MSRSQWAARLTSAVALVAVMIAAPSTHPVALVVGVLMVGAAALLVWRPEPVAGVLCVALLAVWLLMAPISVFGPRPLLVAALVAVHLAGLALASSAPAHARLDPVLVRRYALRCAGLVGAAAATWGLVHAALLVPSAPVAVMAGGLLAVAALAWWLLRDGRRDDDARA